MWYVIALTCEMPRTLITPRDHDVRTLLRADEFRDNGLF